MDQIIDEIRNNIKSHKTSVTWLSVAMCLIVALALLAYILIVAILDNEINRVTELVKFAVENKVSELPKDPSKLVFAGRDNNMGYLVLAMFVAVLLAIFSKIRFHLKELSINEQRLYILFRIKAANNTEISSEVRTYLLSNCYDTNSNNDPIINISSEMVTKISDTIMSRVEGMSKSKN